MGDFVVFFKNKIFSLAMIFVGLILASPMVHAQYPDLTAASWDGSNPSLSAILYQYQSSISL